MPCADTVFALPPDRNEHRAKMRQVKMAVVGASVLAFTRTAKTIP
jgi:hypothetical protein